jgi:hypothetical protein
VVNILPVEFVPAGQGVKTAAKDEVHACEMYVPGGFLVTEQTAVLVELVHVNEPTVLVH